jgi:large subunit ribosomal protein L30
MFAVIRLRSSAKLRKEAVATMKLLRLNRPMHCVLIREGDDSFNGMLQSVRDRITWGPIDDKMLADLIKKRGRKIGDARLTQEEVSKAVTFVKQNNKLPPDIKPVFRLTPPSKGFKKEIKQFWPNGELGNRGDSIIELLKRMI